MPTRWFYHLSAYWFGSSFQWLLLLLILMPADVVRFVGQESKGTYLGLLGTLGAIIALTIPPVIGAYSDRIGKRLVFIRWGTAANIIGLAIMAFAPSYWVYFVGFLFVQFGNNFATAPYSALIPQLVPPERRGQASGVMNLLQAGGQLLGGVSALVFGLLASQGVLEVPREVSYALIAVLLIGSASVTLTKIKEPDGQVQERAPSIPWWQIFAFHAFLWVFITRALFSLGQYSVQPFLQYYIQDVLGFTKSPGTMTAVMLMVIITGSIFTSLIAGRLSDRVGRKPIIYVAGTLMAVCVLLFLVAPSIYVALLLALVFGFGYGAFGSVDWALGSDAMPSARSYARDMGIWHVALVGPQLTSAPQGALLDWGNRMGDGFGYTVVFGIAAACFMLGVVLVSRIRGLR